VGRERRAGVLASTMLDAYAVADAILADSHTGEAGAGGWSDDALVADGAVDLESVPREVEEGVRARRVSAV